ncbi:hypothetical protein NECAME_15765 [Necator americanus]|uniref:Neurotransmitter-gated ion-channel ligand-binding domain-containing protein n=1 Tax=Necator americanus TaxID=51031 RepID=W2SFZ4_NECAM|nr:hypothetical protein NECAME_15765 [Necator americanus]ETN68544.1 hypothetical protein NECAME_15765 [Necator americanus]
METAFARKSWISENPASGPVSVNVSIVVSNVRSVSEVTMTEISLHESYSNFLWHPDTFVPNAIASKNPRKQSITHRSLLRITSTIQNPLARPKAI